jgi:hypothetical protein
MTRRGFIGLGAAGAAALAAGKAVPSLFGGGSSNSNPTFVDLAATQTGGGLWLLDSAGRLLALGDAQSLVSIPPEKFPQVVAIAGNPAGAGLWALTETGDVRGFGDAKSANASAGSARAVDVAAVPMGNGSWTPAKLDETGQVTFPIDTPLWAAIPPEKFPQAVAIAGNPAGAGMWILTASGDAVGFGGAQTFKSTGGATRYVDLAAITMGNGAWGPVKLNPGGIVVPVDTGWASIPPEKFPQLVAVAATPNGTGMWVLDTAGVVHALGSAPQLVVGSLAR